MSVEVRVLGVNGSPRRYGSAYKLLRVALRAAEAEGAGEMEDWVEAAADQALRRGWRNTMST